MGPGPVRGLAPIVPAGAGSVGMHRRPQAVEPRRRQVDPAQIGLEVEEGVVAQELVDRVTGPLQLGQLPHPRHVTRALSVEGGGGVAVEQQREDDLGEKRRVQIRLRCLGLAEPALELGRAVLGDHVALAVGALARLLGVEDHEAVALPAREGRVDLAVSQRPGVGEPGVVGALQVVAMARARSEQAEHRVRAAHRSSVRRLSARIARPSTGRPRASTRAPTAAAAASSSPSASQGTTRPMPRTRSSVAVTSTPTTQLATDATASGTRTSSAAAGAAVSTNPWKPLAVCAARIRWAVARLPPVSRYHTVGCRGDLITLGG